MKKQTKQHTKAKQPTERKAFEAPRLRREAELTEATAERTFTFTTAS